MNADIPDELTLKYNRAAAFQLLLVLEKLNTIASIHYPGLVTMEDVVIEKIEQLQAFVEGSPS